MILLSFLIQATNEWCDGLVEMVEVEKSSSQMLDAMAWQWIMMDISMFLTTIYMRCDDGKLVILIVQSWQVEMDKVIVSISSMDPSISLSIKIIQYTYQMEIIIV